VAGHPEKKQVGKPILARLTEEFGRMMEKDFTGRLDRSQWGQFYAVIA